MFDFQIVFSSYSLSLSLSPLLPLTISLTISCSKAKQIKFKKVKWSFSTVSLFRHSTPKWWTYNMVTFLFFCCFLNIALKVKEKSSLDIHNRTKSFQILSQSYKKWPISLLNGQAMLCPLTDGLPNNLWKSLFKFTLVLLRLFTALLCTTQWSLLLMAIVRVYITLYWVENNKMWSNCWLLLHHTFYWLFFWFCCQIINLTSKL